MEALGGLAGRASSLALAARRAWLLAVAGWDMSLSDLERPEAFIASRRLRCGLQIRRAER